MANIPGTEGDDTLVDTNDNDTINALGGNDTITVRNGYDSVNAGAGVDTLIVDYGAETNAVTTITFAAAQTGEAGFNGNYATGTNSRRVDFFHADKFVVTTGSGNDIIRTGSGSDVVDLGAGDDLVDLGAGSYSADGGEGVDGVSADLSAFGAGVTVDLSSASSTGAAGTLANFEYLGTLTTTAFDDVVVTRDIARDEIVITGAGADSVTVRRGYDRVNTGAGVDTLVVDYSAETNAVSTITFAAAQSSEGGFNGNYATGNGSRRVDFFHVDNLAVTTGSGNDSIRTGSGNDIVNLGAGDDVVDLGSGSDSADGGEGVDGVSANLSTFGAGVTVDLTASSTAGAAGTLANFEYIGTLTTTAFDDVVVTRDIARDEVINTGAGADSVTVRNGYDRVGTGAGVDTLVVDYSSEINAVSTISFAAAQTAEGGFNGNYATGNGSRRVDFFNADKFVITTGAGADTITTGSGDDIVNTGGGVDIVNAGAGNDTLDGGAGNDTLNGEGGDDTLISDRGNDQLNGGTGLDTLVLAYGDATGAVAYFSGPSPDGSGGLNGGIFENGGGRQVAFNAIERFVITTGAGADMIITGTGNDVVITGAGDDSVDVRSGTDSADGGAGDDMISADLSDAAGAIVWNLQTNSFSGGPDSFANFEYFGTITTAAGNDVITTSALRKNEVMNTGAGNDTVTVLAGNDTFNAGAGLDTLIVAWGDAIGGVAFFSGPSSDGSGGFNGGIFESVGNRQVAFTSVERFIITSGAGGDSLTTGAGDDVVNTGEGDDFVDVRTGADSSDGGAGLDGISADLTDAAGAVIWNLQTNSFSGGPDSFANFEYFGTITTGAGNDVITTSAIARNEVINTGAGNDTVTVVAGFDQVNAGTGFDTLILAWGGATGSVSFYSGPSANGDGSFNGGLFESGGGARQVAFQNIERFVITTGSGNDTIVGATGDDEIRTGAGNDTLNGGEGDDYLDGGTGADTMTGGRGSDTFAVDSAGDTIVEQAGQGIDTVETALAAYTLAANVENIAGAGMAQALTGNALNNGMLGTLGDDMLIGAAGDDVIVGSLGADAIDGGEGRDILVAGLIDPTNLIVNGSFETQDGANSARQYILDDGDDYNGVTYRFASTLFGWTRSGADGGDIELNTYGTNGGFDRGNGSVALDLEADPGENLSIYQDIPGIPGGTPLILSFAAGQGTGGSLGANPTAALEVVWNGVVIATIVSASTAMTQHAFVVTASGTGQDRLEFREVGGGADARGTALDAVALNVIAPGFDEAANTLVGGSGGDTLIGDVGNDRLRGDQGADLLVGGEGIDTVDYAGESGNPALVNLSSATAFLGGIELAAGTARDTHGSIDTLIGIENVTTGSGDDQVLGGSGANDISTGGGNDRLDGGEGADTLAGGTGDDTYTDDDAEADTITERENEGTDTVRTNQAVYSIAAIAHVENLTGTADTGQTLTGNAGDNSVSGAAGNDTLAGGAGNDTLNGNDGDDTLIYNGLGNDPARGGAGTDTLVVDFSGATASIVDNPNAGRFGFDAGYWDQAANSVAFTSIERIQITTGAFADTITTYGGNDEIRTGAGADTLNGGGGNDLLDGGADADNMSGGSGNDIYIVDNRSDVVTENEEDGTDEVRTALGGKGGASELYVLAANVENLTGTSSSGQGVRGNALNNIISLGRGADLVVAEDGGNDTITTGAGNDFIYFGGAFTAEDRVDGGAGTDTVGLLGSYNLTLVEGSLQGVERLALYTGQPGTGGVANGYVITTADATVAAGAQLFVTAASLAASEAFTFNGTAESDGRFVIQSGAGNDILAGGAGNDSIRGGAGDDQLFGLDGNDILVGGAGADALRGGLGADRFVYESTADSAGSAIDRIRDFQKGTDRIDLSAIDAISGTATNDGFTFIGTNVAFGQIAGELRVVNEAGQWFVQGDVNGDGAADLVIRIDNGANFIFTSSDFLL